MTPGTIGIALALGITGILAIIIFIRAHVVVCAPNEAVIFSGRKKGYRIIRAAAVSAVRSSRRCRASR